MWRSRAVRELAAAPARWVRAGRGGRIKRHGKKGGGGEAPGARGSTGGSRVCGARAELEVRRGHGACVQYAHLGAPRALDSCCVAARRYGACGAARGSARGMRAATPRPLGPRAERAERCCPRWRGLHATAGSGAGGRSGAAMRLRSSAGAGGSAESGAYGGACARQDGGRKKGGGREEKRETSGRGAADVTGARSSSKDSSSL